MKDLEELSKFDIDLKYGQIREEKVRDMFANKTIEVKSERFWWETTGNIALEYEYNGKPSGVYKTESDYWFHRLEKEEGEFCTLVFPTPVLRGLVDKYKDTRSKYVGDNQKSKCVLLPLSEVFV